MSGMAQTPPERKLARSASASEKANAWAEKKKLQMERAAELKRERNGKQAQEEAFQKALEDAGEQLVISWTNDRFPQTPPQPPQRSRNSSSSGGGSGKKERSPGDDAAMLDRLKAIEAKRAARRAGQAAAKQKEQEVLAANPGMDPGDIAL